MRTWRGIKHIHTYTPSWPQNDRCICGGGRNAAIHYDSIQEEGTRK